jgi:HK97 family phage major capsid protein
VNEGTATSGAAGVAEAGTKPESPLKNAEIQEPVKTIATALPVSDEMLEDAPSIQAYLNGRLNLFVRIEEERRLLRGAGTNELLGLLKGPVHRRLTPTRSSPRTTTWSRSRK